MSRKWSVLAATMISSALLVAGLSFADDEESPLGKVMTKVNKANGAVRKVVRNPAAFKKANNGKDVVEKANELVKLGQEAREMKYALKKAKGEPNPQAKWYELMDAFIKSSQELGQVAGGAEPTQEATKASFDRLNKACNNCHKVFKVDNE